MPWEAGQKVLLVWEENGECQRRAVTIEHVSPKGFALVEGVRFHPEGYRIGDGRHQDWRPHALPHLEECDEREWETAGTSARRQRVRRYCASRGLLDDWTLKLSDETLAALERDLGLAVEPEKGGDRG